jgi:predicted dehydrogenase
LLESGTIDAVYIATPNWRHAEFAVPALRAGVHVLVEKPMEVSTRQCRDMLEAQRMSTAKLMVACRLHFEPATLAAIDRARSGDLGEVTTFMSAFSRMVSPKDQRAGNGDLAGPVLDLGLYPVNAARAIFGAEPIEVVSAVGSRHAEAELGDFDDTVSVTLRFPGDRIAQFAVSYDASGLDSYCIIGTKGSLHVAPGYMYGKSLEHRKILGESKNHGHVAATDQLGGELRYFSDCIIHGTDPEPDGEEGFADVRVLEGILTALRTGQPCSLPPFARNRRIGTVARLQELSPQKPSEPTDPASPARSRQTLAEA